MQATMSNGMVEASSHSHGGRAWIAKIVGPDPKYRLARQFEGKRDVDTTGNKYRQLEWAFRASEGDIYEHSDAVSSGRTERGFWIVRNGTLQDIEYAEVVALVNKPVAAVA